jgi:hypothetical protein
MQGCLRSGLLQLSCCNTGLCVLQAYTTAHCAVVQLRRAGDSKGDLPEDVPLSIHPPLRAEQPR